jgi:hypothetical protein
MQGEEFVFEQHDTFIVGRMDDCHVVIPQDRLVSRHHFIMEVNPPSARIRDLGSLNGTYVNGKKHGGRKKSETPEEGARRQYPELDLCDGDEVKVGGTIMRVRIEQLVQDARSRPAAPPCCQLCRKDVSREVSSGHPGVYVCEDCRRRIVDGPSAILSGILRATAQVLGSAELSIPDYEIVGKLGEGGMGAVYLVRHKQTGKQAALKVMLSKVAVDEVARQRFMHEIQNMRALRHENIVEFYHHGSSGGMFYFLIEFCGGGSVADLVTRRGGRLALAEAGPIALQALKGLAFAHRKGFVHRDFKPQNLLLTGNGRPWIAKVADLGLTKNFEQAGFSGMTATGSYAGTYPFMPAEQIIDFKYVRPVTDVWAMGATLYNMLTGQYPYDFRRGEDPVAVILARRIVPIGKRGIRIPTRVAQVIDRSLAANVKDRYQDAGEMLDALSRVL